LQSLYHESNEVEVNFFINEFDSEFLVKISKQKRRTISDSPFFFLLITRDLRLTTYDLRLYLVTYLTVSQGTSETKDYGQSLGPTIIPYLRKLSSKALNPPKNTSTATNFCQYSAWSSLTVNCAVHFANV